MITGKRGLPFRTTLDSRLILRWPYTLAAYAFFRPASGL